MKYFYFFLILYSNTLLFSMSDQEKELLARYSVPVDIQRVLDKHPDDVVKCFKGPQKFGWLPGYYVKKDFSRLKGAEILRECIAEKNCNLFDVTEKFGYQEPRSGKLYVISKEVIEDKEKWPYSAQHIKQAAIIRRDTNFHDFNCIEGANLKRRNGKLVFVDTQLEAFVHDCTFELAMRPLYDHKLSHEAKKQLDKEISYENNKNKAPGYMYPLAVAGLGYLWYSMSNAISINSQK